MVDETFNIDITAKDRTAAAFNSAANNARNIAAAAKRSGVSFDEMQRRVTNATKVLGATYVPVIENVRKLGRESEKAHKAHASHAGLAARATHQFNEVVQENIGKFLTLGAAVEGAREAFLEYANMDARLRRFSVQTGASLHSVEAMIPAWRAVAKETTNSLDSMLDAAAEIRSHGSATKDQIEKLVPSIARGARAIGVLPAQIGGAFGSMMTNMKATGEDVDKIMEQMAFSANNLQVDFTKMGDNMPRLTQELGKWGFAGQEGSARMLAYLASIRKASAAPVQDLQHVMQIISSPVVGEKLGRNGTRWTRELHRVAKDNVDVLGYSLREIKKRIDAGTPLESLVPVRYSLMVHRLLEDLDTIPSTMRQIGQSSGEVEKAGKAMEGPRAAVDRLKGAFSETADAVGNLLDKLGATTGIEGFARRIKSLGDTMDWVTGKSKALREELEHEGKVPPAHKPRVFGPLRSPGLRKQLYPKGIGGANTLSRAGGGMGGLASRAFDAMTYTAKIPGEVYGGRYNVGTETPGVLTEEDVLRQDAAGAQERKDAMGMVSYGTGARGLTGAERLLPDFVPGIINKGIPLNRARRRNEGQAAGAGGKQLPDTIDQLSKQLQENTQELRTLSGELKGAPVTHTPRFGRGGAARWGGGRAGSGMPAGGAPSSLPGAGGGFAFPGLGGIPGMGGGSSGAAPASAGGGATSAVTGAASGLAGKVGDWAKGGLAGIKSAIPGMGGGGAAGTPSAGDPRGMIPYIRETAQKYGIDPDIAVRVAKSEGLLNPVGDKGKSHGAFQLYTGGGLGNEFQKKTGMDPSAPGNERATIDYALQHASTKGWGAFHGAKRVGIQPFQGIGGTPSAGGAGGVLEKQGGIRNLPLPAAARSYLDAASAKTGLIAEVVSGGQPGSGPHRTGSHRHDVTGTGAGDIKLKDPVTGQYLDMRNPADQARMGAFAEHARRAGATGIGAGLGYMGPNTMHVGGGTPGTWGAGGKGANTPPWLADAYQRGGRPEAPGAAAPSAMGGQAPMGLEHYQRVREEMSKPIPLSFKADPGSEQFARSSMRREADREVREARWNTYSDIGAA